MRPRWWILLAVIVISYLAGYSPFGTVLHLTNQVWGSFRTSIGPTGPEDSLVAAVRNVTSDCDQLTDILKEFFKQTERTNPHVQEHFIYFLKERAGRGHAKLERVLDWLLAIYKIAFPFLVCLMVAKVSGGSREGSVADDSHGGGSMLKAAHKRGPNGHLPNHREYSPPLSPLLESGTAYSSLSASSHLHSAGSQALMEHSRSRGRSGSDLAMRASGF